MTLPNNTEKPGSLRTWLDFIEGINPDDIDLGLNRVGAVFSALNLESYFRNIPVIEVAGTNGKGSTCAFIASVLNNAGIKTGLYTSPHLTRFNERVEIGGVIVSDEELTSAFTEVHECCNGIKLTYFEYTTLAALVCYRNAGVKAAVLEIGLGGRLDAVNILDADIAVITSIGLDHTRILGDTIEKIAFEKAGIIKKDKVCVTGIVEDKVKAVIKEICAKNQADVFFETDDFNHSFDEKVYTFTDANGQRKYHAPRIPEICVASSLKVIDLLKQRGIVISDEDINRALDTTALPGRMQKVHEKPSVYLDVAHNPPAAVHLRDTLKNKNSKGKKIAVIGMLKDKDIESVLNILSGSFDSYHVASLHTQRGEHKDRLKKSLILCSVPQDLVKSYDYVEEALNCAYSEASADDEIFVLGSFVTVKEAVDALAKNNYQEK